MKGKITLKEAAEFHGHLGPYLVLGVLAGELALKKLKCNKYFGITVRVYGANKKPKSCLIDGLQLSTGATYGKGNIQKFNGRRIKINFASRHSGKNIAFTLKPEIIRQLENAKTHEDCEILAGRLYRTNSSNIFNVVSKKL